MSAGSFVGRAADLDAIEQLFFSESARMVTVVGPGGVGKTRLAHELVTRCEARARFAGGARFVELAQCRSGEEVCAAVARAVGSPLLSARSTEDAATQVGSAVALLGDALVVLDNLEHLTEEAASLCERWLRAAPRARWLVTSRERLRVYDERAYELEPLGTDTAPGALAPAVQLFVDRARAADARFAPDAATLDEIAELVRSLDGLPLAIELAAARASMLTPAQLRDRLRDRFALLAGGLRGRDARQATLRAAIDGSWNLLPPHEQRALARCSAFRGSFDLDAAEAVLADEQGASPLDLLQALRDKSLVRVPPEPRGRFALYESICAYAEAQLVAAGPEAVADAHARHARHYLARGARLAAASTGPAALDALGALALEHDNLRAVCDRGLARGDEAGVVRAIEALLALDALWSVRGPTSVRLAAFEQARAQCTGSVPAAVRARAALAVGMAHKALGAWALAEQRVTEAAELAREASDPVTEGRALGHRATARAAQGRGAEAERDFDEAVALLERAGDAHGAATVHGNRGVYESWLGRHERALHALQRALEGHRALGDQHSEGIHLGRLAILHAELERRSEARALCREALARLERAGDVRFAAGVYSVLGVIEHEDGALDEAASCAARAAALQRRVGDRYSEATAVYYGARVGHERGDLAGAREGYRAALTLFEARNDPRNVALLRAALAALDAREGRLVEAARSHEEAVALASEAGDALRTTCVRAYGGLLALARAAEALRSGDEPAAQRERAAAAALEAATAQVRHQSEDARFVLRLLAQARLASAEPGKVLRAARDGAWFEAPGAARAALEKRRTLRGLFAALLDARLVQPGAVLERDALLAAGWPGEKMRADAAMNRLYVALNALRKLGLGELLQSVDAGWRLAPETTVLAVEARSSKPPSAR